MWMLGFAVCVAVMIMAMAALVRELRHRPEQRVKRATQTGWRYTSSRYHKFNTFQRKEK